MHHGRVPQAYRVKPSFKSKTQDYHASRHGEKLEGGRSTPVIGMSVNGIVPPELFMWRDHARRDSVSTYRRSYNDGLTGGDCPARPPVIARTPKVGEAIHCFLLDTVY